MRLRSLLAGAVLGALAAHYLDPINGRSRRARLRDRAAGRGRRVLHRLERGAVHLEHDAEGVAARLTHPVPDAPADDLTLLDRVTSDLYLRHPELKGVLNLEAEKGWIRIRGEVPAASQGEHIAGFVQAVPGVKGVENLTHELGTTAPNKAAALKASKT